MESFIIFLAEYSRVFALAHTVATAIGLGAATITDILFFRFSKDLKISKTQADMFFTISRAIWAALGVIVISGVGLYIPQAANLNHSPGFLMKMIIVTVLIVNGILLNLVVAPQLINISFDGQLRRVRKLAFALGAVSIVSWYGAFFLGSLRFLTFDFGVLSAIYCAALFGAVIGSQIIERRLNRRSSR